ncbi:hypothetical protein HYH02_000515 [Chlamydomonas schloesseri]|uniref:Guanylate cyclase domain-containing protein n=1 Tax=Chlamydomonas schloesseri TaxID=2026947 RepID=A0A835WVZ4_9CHLO|nr:hypothetical protein HYH02_000515 [Chlamydomonas schloesseri]|eukprot:KAG2454676.1 hypothetical protein HYH02_000515 [Chlamydomonas schloesseri]
MLRLNEPTSARDAIPSLCGAGLIDYFSLEPAVWDEVQETAANGQASYSAAVRVPHPAFWRQRLSLVALDGSSRGGGGGDGGGAPAAAAPPHDQRPAMAGGGGGGGSQPPELGRPGGVASVRVSAGTNAASAVANTTAAACNSNCVLSNNDILDRSQLTAAVTVVAETSLEARVEEDGSDTAQTHASTTCDTEQLFESLSLTLNTVAGAATYDGGLLSGSACDAAAAAGDSYSYSYSCNSQQLAGVHGSGSGSQLLAAAGDAAVGASQRALEPAVAPGACGCRQQPRSATSRLAAAVEGYALVRPRGGAGGGGGASGAGGGELDLLPGMQQRGANGGQQVRLLPSSDSSLAARPPGLASAGASAGCGPASSPLPASLVPPGGGGVTPLGGAAAAARITGGGGASDASSLSGAILPRLQALSHPHDHFPLGAAGTASAPPGLDDDSNCHAAAAAAAAATATITTAAASAQQHGYVHVRGTSTSGGFQRVSYPSSSGQHGHHHGRVSNFSSTASHGHVSGGAQPPPRPRRTTTRDRLHNLLSSLENLSPADVLASGPGSGAAAAVAVSGPASGLASSGSSPSSASTAAALAAVGSGGTAQQQVQQQQVQQQAAAPAPLAVAMAMDVAAGMGQEADWSGRQQLSTPVLQYGSRGLASRPFQRSASSLLAGRAGGGASAACGAATADAAGPGGAARRNSGREAASSSTASSSASQPPSRRPGSDPSLSALDISAAASVLSSAAAPPHARGSPRVSAVARRASVLGVTSTFPPSTAPAADGLAGPAAGAAGAPTAATAAAGAPVAGLSPHDGSVLLSASRLSRDSLVLEGATTAAAAPAPAPAAPLQQRRHRSRHSSYSQVLVAAAEEENQAVPFVWHQVQITIKREPLAPPQVEDLAPAGGSDGGADGGRGGGGGGCHVTLLLSAVDVIEHVVRSAHYSRATASSSSSSNLALAVATGGGGSSSGTGPMSGCASRVASGALGSGVGGGTGASAGAGSGLVAFNSGLFMNNSRAGSFVGVAAAAPALSSAAGVGEPGVDGAAMPAGASTTTTTPGLPLPPLPSAAPAPLMAASVSLLLDHPSLVAASAAAVAAVNSRGRRQRTSVGQQAATSLAGTAASAAGGSGGGLPLATAHRNVTVLFADIVGFTSMCNELEPIAVMAFLNGLFTRFDCLCDIYGVYKVETIGDCFMAVGGLITVDGEGFKAVRGDGSEDDLHALKVLCFAKAMLREVALMTMPHNGQPLQLRVGLHSGPVTAGIVGAKMPRFCLFGDTVNTASRMESTCEPGAVHVSAATQALLPEEDWAPTGGVQVKGKGTMQTFLWRPPPLPDCAVAAAAAAVSAGGAGGSLLAPLLMAAAGRATKSSPHGAQQGGQGQGPQGSRGLSPWSSGPAVLPSSRSADPDAATLLDKLAALLAESASAPPLAGCGAGATRGSVGGSGSRQIDAVGGGGGGGGGGSGGGANAVVPAPADSVADSQGEEVSQQPQPAQQGSRLRSRSTPSADSHAPGPAAAHAPPSVGAAAASTCHHQAASSEGYRARERGQSGDEVAVPPLPLPPPPTPVPPPPSSLQDLYGSSAAAAVAARSEQS